MADADPLLDLTAEQYRMRARMFVVEGLNATSGPLGDRRIAAAAVYAELAKSAPITGESC